MSPNFSHENNLSHISLRLSCPFDRRLLLFILINHFFFTLKMTWTFSFILKINFSFIFHLISLFLFYLRLDISNFLFFNCLFPFELIWSRRWFLLNTFNNLIFYQRYLIDLIFNLLLKVEKTILDFNIILLFNILNWSLLTLALLEITWWTAVIEHTCSFCHT